MPSAASSSAMRVHEVPGAGFRGHVGGADRGLDLGRRERRRHDDPAEPAGTHVPGRGARRREDPVEVDVDHAIPALVAVALERALLHPRPLARPPRRRRSRHPGRCRRSRMRRRAGRMSPPPRRSHDRARRDRSRRRRRPAHRVLRPAAARPARRPRRRRRRSASRARRAPPAPRRTRARARWHRR